MSLPPAAFAETDSLSRRQIVLLVTALVFSVMSFSLNATMLSPAVRDINETLGPGAFAAMSTPFYHGRGDRQRRADPME